MDPYLTQAAQSCYPSPREYTKNSIEIGLVDPAVFDTEMPVMLRLWSASEGDL